jgi:hypothetical protein
MQHCRYANLRLELALTELQQRGAGTVKEQLVKGALVLADQRIERVRQRKNDVEVRDG